LPCFFFLNYRCSWYWFIVGGGGVRQFYMLILCFNQLFLLILVHAATNVPCLILPIFPYML
jgi:hypothetical protein